MWTFVLVQKQKLQNRIGFSKKGNLVLFLVGMLLCTYPFAGNLITKLTYTDAVEQSDDLIAILEIPKIELKLPIYHGTEEAVLQKGIGHICGSDLPVGGESSHSLLAGHRGLPHAELFTRLNELEIGDEFVIHICDEKHTYEVCKIFIIEPDDTSALCVQDGRDLISLITCTPYGINTHRLVVMGERKEDK